jgi:hypothetical protein
MLTLNMATFWTSIFDTKVDLYSTPKKPFKISLESHFGLLLLMANKKMKV